MVATRLLRMSRPSGFTESFLSNSYVLSKPRTLVCLNKVGRSSEISPAGGGERKPATVKAAGYTSAFVVFPETKTRTDDKRMALGLLLGYVGDALLYWRKFVQQQRSSAFHIQMSFEKAIVDCRFFTLLAIGGSLLCSLLCYFEGCFLVVGSYLQYFHALSRMSEQGQVVHLLIEAIDMFIMGTAMLVFAMALYAMFVGQNRDTDTREGSHHSGSALSNNFNLKVASWMERGSAIDAKSKIGHAVMLILQVQVLDKFRSIGVSNGMDLACFAGAIFLSSASIFILSRSHTHTKKEEEEEAALMKN